MRGEFLTFRNSSPYKEQREARVQVTVCYHALLREHTERCDERYTFGGQTSTADDVLRAVLHKYPALEKIAPVLKIAINDEMMERGNPVRDGDRLDLFPPFGGG